ncbi:MAG: hypothetical protein QW625_00875 [Candidatus Nanoarchaeia archaeon]
MAIQNLNEKHFAITFGSFLVVVKALGLLLISLGYGAFLNVAKVSEGLTLGSAVMALVITFVIGAILGWIFAGLWNYFAKQSWAR